MSKKTRKKNKKLNNYKKKVAISEANPSRPRIWTRDVIIWVSAVSGCLAVLLGLLTFLHTKRSDNLNSQLKAKQHLWQSVDLMAGSPGVRKVIDPNTNQNDLELARRELIQALLMDQSNPDGKKVEGFYLQQIGQLRDALKKFHDVIRNDPSDFVTYSNMGSVHRELGEIEKAISAYNTAIKISPRYSTAYYNLGNALNELGEYDSAIISYQQALSLNPNHVASHHNLGRLFRKLGRFVESINELTKATQIDRSDPRLYWNLSFSLWLNNDVTEAEKMIREAIELDHSAPESHELLGKVLFSQRRVKEAEVACLA